MWKFFGFLRNRVIQDMPPAMDACFDCSKPICKEEQFKNCNARLKRLESTVASQSGSTASDDRPASGEGKAIQ